LPDTNLWPEVVAGVADGLGLWGAYLLAWPFVETQRITHTAIILQQSGNPGDDDFENTKRAALDDLIHVISERAPKEYRRGRLGVRLIGAAFGLRLIPVVISVIEALVDKLRSI
jgi:hypothetical protein